MLAITGMYTCWAAAARIGMNSRIGFYSLVALLHPIFCTMYELTGVNLGWFYWGSKEPSLQTRVYNVPIMAIYFHFAFGFCLVAARDLAQHILGVNKSTARTFIINALEVIICVILAPTLALAFDIPTHVLERFVGVSRIYTVALIMSGSALVVVWDLVVMSRRNAGRREEYIGMDWLLLLTPLSFCTFILSSHVVVALPPDSTLTAMPSLLYEAIVYAPYRLMVLCDAAVATIAFSACCFNDVRQRAKPE